MLHVFADMCQAYGVDEIVAVATSAVRDAENGEEFLNRVREETGLNIRIISGREEARLIWRGVSSGLEKSDELRLFVDIGGGSTEVIAGTTRECYSLDSMKLGCVRLASWLKDGTQKISEKEFLNLQMRIRDVGVHVFRRLADMRVAKIVASSGTAQNLAEIAANLAGVDGSGRYSDTPQLLTYRGDCARREGTVFTQSGGTRAPARHQLETRGCHCSGRGHSPDYHGGNGLRYL